MNEISSNSGEIVLYQPDETIRLEVRMGEDSVWLTQQQMAELFLSSRTNIGEHIQHIYNEKELEENSTCRKFRQVRQEGKRMVTRTIPMYNLDVIIGVGYRVNSKRGTKFRQWANQVLKDYLLKGYSINRRFEQLEQRVSRTEDIERHNSQYPAIEVKQFNRAHDRFLLIDDEVYHIGASIKDLGKKWFAFTLMHDITPSMLSEHLSEKAKITPPPLQ